MKSTDTFDAATAPVLTQGTVAGVRRAAPSISMVQGTGLPFGDRDRTRLLGIGIGAHTCGLGIDGGTGVDQVKATVVRMPAAADPGIPPRRTPSRC